MTFTVQSEYFISEKISYTTLKFVYDNKYSKKYLL